ncbi:MAG: MBL fold metallo-hydrolase [Hydrogenophilales bacterium 12-61-10]|jgi:glyoxylase-like metal-dependent hydrolase (beta-lactamase superfamily II)|nr:MAG: MBL fold metallo-hydrolase [Hydrogenophilales bacterium 12-61-10]OYX28075.1 MAG: MBL fold metallo-hydrolase [Hydrogenophilales bacterium 32-62-9]OYY59543.1 MAG: MBL fold metallo-hydrolase [Hydrogenophilales bacterium 28-61-11]OZA45431.1 MAG: MBL fold metallo-hydrolase [Hydrogenophilales bacterium 17-61-76]
MKNWLRYSIFALLGMLMQPAFAAEWLPEPIRVSSHAWAWIGPYEGPNKANRGFRMNLGFVTGKDAVAVIDSGYSPEMAQAMLRQIRKRTPLPVRYVINTNSQPHRFLGNDVFREAGAEIIAAREAAARMESEGAGLAAAATSALELKEGSIQAPKAPDRMIEEGAPVAIELGGGVRLKIIHLGQAHTRGSLVVEVVPDMTVFAGDILYGGRLLAVLPDSSLTGWIAAYDKLRGMKAKQMVPGHGEVAPLASFEHPTYRYLAALKSHMDKAVKEGVDVGQATADFDAAAWKNLANFAELAGRNASLAYLESEAEGF